METDVNTIWDTVYAHITTYGLKILAAALIFFIGRFIVGIIVKFTGNVIDKRKLDPSLKGFTTGLLHALLLTIVILATLSQLGIQTTSFVAIIGAAGLAVGLALQGSLSNFAAGVLIIIFKPYRVGDYVEAGGAEGFVEEIGIFVTTITAPNNTMHIVPNALATGGVIKNFTAKGRRRIDMTIGISYEDDLLAAKKMLEELIGDDERVLKEPSPFVGVSEMADSSVNFAFRPWVKPEHYWPVYFDMTERAKLALEANGFTIPFPQRDVHLFSEEKSSEAL